MIYNPFKESDITALAAAHSKKSHAIHRLVDQQYIEELKLRIEHLESENKLLRNALIRIEDSSIPCSDSTDLVATAIFKDIARQALNGDENEAT